MADEQQAKEQFSDTVRPLLSKALMPALISRRNAGRDDPQEYIPIHVAITQANRIFGHGNWTTQIVMHKPIQNSGGVTIGYSCIVRVSIPLLNAQYEGYGFQPLTISHGKIMDDASSHDSAAKGAESDAIKRALRYLGDTFGNSLYEKDKERIPVAEMAAKAIAKQTSGDAQDRDALDEAKRKVRGPYRSLADVPINVSLGFFYQAIDRTPSRNGHQPNHDTPPEPPPAKARTTNESDDDYDDNDPFS